MLCTIFMSLSIAATTSVGLAQITDMADMGGMTATNTSTSQISQNAIINFFLGFWGEVILLLSFGLMLAGMWFRGSRKVMPLSIAGATILYYSMYVHYSISLEIAGAVMLAFAYACAYNYKIAKLVRLGSSSASFFHY